MVTLLMTLKKIDELFLLIKIYYVALEKASINSEPMRFGSSLRKKILKIGTFCKKVC